MNERSRSDKRRSKRKTLWFVTIFAVLLILVGGYEWTNRDEKQTNASPPKQETAAEKKVAPKEKVAKEPNPTTDDTKPKTVAEDPEPTTENNTLSSVLNKADGELIMEFLDGQFQLTNMLKEADEEYYNMSLEYPVKGNAMTTGDALSLMVNGMSDKITGIQKSSTADSEIKSIAIALSPKIIEMQSAVASLVSSEKWLKDNDMSMRQTGYYQGQEAIQKLMELNNEMDTSAFSQLDLPIPDIDGV